jgi:ABC-type nitrate/sulfonate/bicarbonate transport system ATPase subunit
MIGLKNVTFSYGTDPVLQAFSLELQQGEKVCLFGPSGCGKTTVLHLLAGALHPQKGEVYTLPTAMVFQEDRLLPWMTVLENVAVVLDDDEAQETASFWLEAVGLSDVKNELPKALSGGMRRRVAIARALAKGGDLLLLDEPFSGLDADNRQRCAELIRKRFDSATVVLVTHLEEEANLLDAKVVKM